MSKKVSPMIKSQTRVKSMFAFMKEDNNNVYNNDINKFRNTKNNEDFNEDNNFNNEFNDNEILSSSKQVDENASLQNDNTEVSETSNKGGAVVLQRSRGNVTINSSESNDEENKKQLNTNSSENFIEIQSNTFDGQVKTAEKKTFKTWWQNLMQKMAQGWDSFIHKKGATRLLAIIVVLVVLVVAMIIYTATIRTSVKDLFLDNARAFIITESDESGTGTMTNFKIDDLMKGEPTAKNTAGYQFIDFYCKDLNEDVYINRLSFYIYTEFTDLTINAKLKVLNGEETVYQTVDAKRYDLNQRVAVKVSFNYVGNFTINENMTFVLEFDAVKTSNIATPYDVEFSIFNLQYS